MIPMVYTHFGPSDRQREFADFYFRFKKPLAPEKSYTKMNDKEGRSSKRSTPDTLYRYTSLVRSACSPGRPTTLLCVLRANPRGNAVAIGYHGEVTKVSGAGAALIAATQETDIGKEKCKRHQSFLQWWQYSVWRVALKMILNVVPLELWPVPSRLMCSARTRRQPSQQAHSWAQHATTGKTTFAVKSENSAPLTGRTTSWNRRWGMRPAAVFCFGDKR